MANCGAYHHKNARPAFRCHHIKHEAGLFHDMSIDAILAWYATGNLQGISMPKLESMKAWVEALLSASWYPGVITVSSGVMSLSIELICRNYRLTMARDLDNSSGRRCSYKNCISLFHDLWALSHFQHAAIRNSMKFYMKELDYKHIIIKIPALYTSIPNIILIISKILTIASTPYEADWCELPRTSTILRNRHFYVASIICRVILSMKEKYEAGVMKPYAFHYTTIAKVIRY